MTLREKVMCNRNAKSEYILIKKYAHLFLNRSAKELPNFVKKYYLIAELLIFKTPTTKYLLPIQHSIIIVMLLL